MATFTTRITIDNGTVRDYQLLSSLLQENAFEAEPPVTNPKKQPVETQPRELIFIKQGSIQSTVDSVLKAARKTGKKFSFTVIRKKF